MAMEPERSKPLNNFPMPCWGSQKFLKCVKFPTDFSNSNSSPSFDNDIHAVREKLMIDLKVAADKLKVSIFDDANPNPNPKPWNLRTRRAACKAPQNKNTNFVDSVPENSVAKKKKKQKMDESRAKFSVSLSKEEVEQDFLTFVGTKPPRRPKKRPRIVQKKLDTLFPGLWLDEVTAESYKVSDVPE